MTLVLIMLGLAFISFVCAVATEKSIFRVLCGLFLIAALIFFAMLVIIFI